MKVAGYIRVSTAEQALHGYSLDAQTELINRYCAKNGYALTKIYADEGVSASKALHKRHGIISLLEDAEAGLFDTIVFKDLTRWSRNPSQFYAVQERLDRAKVSWISIEQPNLETVTAQGRLMVGITISVAAHESAQTSERLKFVNQSRAAQGYAVNGSVPIGYKLVGESGRKKVVVDEDSRDLALAIFDKYEETQSISETCIFSRQVLGRSLSVVNLRRMLSNTLYFGHYKDNEHFCEPLITKERYELIQKIRARRGYSPPSGRTYLFTGLLRCKHCGSYMRGLFSYGRIYYQCSKRSLYKECDNQRTIREDAIEQYMIANVDESLKQYQVKVKKQKVKDPAPLKAKLDRIKDLYIDGLIDRAEYDKRREVIEKAMIESTPQKPVFALPTDWKEIYANANKEAKKAAWRSVVDRIEVDKDMNIEIFF